MNKLILSSRALLTASSRRQTVLQASLLARFFVAAPQMRAFHTGGPNHNHDHEDDGKQSHSDFAAKSKKAPLNEEQLNAQFGEWVQNNDVVLFMKGSKKMPRCGFSNYAVQVLKFYGV